MRALEASRAAGLPDPARGKMTWRGKIHGEDLAVPPTKRGAKRTQARSSSWSRPIAKTTDEITLVPVAPLTNIAAAILLDPRFAARVPEIVIMGGGHEVGNVTPAAEFNIWCDPEAAAIVLAAGFRQMTLVPLDATHRALVSYADCEKLRGLGTPAGIAAAEFIGHRIEVHDEIQKMAVAGTDAGARCGLRRQPHRPVDHHDATPTCGGGDPWHTDRRPHGDRHAFAAGRRRNATSRSMRTPRASRSF